MLRTPLGERRGRNAVFVAQLIDVRACFHLLEDGLDMSFGESPLVLFHQFTFIHGPQTGLSQAPIMHRIPGSTRPQARCHRSA
jgi:hypothetical protein